MTVMVLNIILPGHQKEIYQKSNHKKSHNSAYINTEFEVITKTRTTETTITPISMFIFVLPLRHLIEK